MTGILDACNKTGSARAVRLATADLARRLKVNKREIVLHSVVPTAWPDASLGCPEPERVYAQVLTTGYVVLLSCGQDVFEYRSDGRRKPVFAGCRNREG
jgi:hypothetical protein